MSTGFWVLYVAALVTYVAILCDVVRGLKD